MPRTSRAIVANYCYHVLNRANEKKRVFHDIEDYDWFLHLAAEAQTRVSLAILAVCLMPNHVHFVMRPQHQDDLSNWMHWLFTSHVGAHRKKYETTGRIWQGRFKAFPIQEDLHFLTVIRYVERNALTSRLVDRAEDWRWGSLSWRDHSRQPLKLSQSPVILPDNWAEHVNTPITLNETAAIQTSINRNRPYGSPDWVSAKARELGLTSSVNPPHRPRKRAMEQEDIFSN
jgi:putative transposase